MLIPDRFEIDFCKDMVFGVIFGVEYQIIATKTKMLGNRLFLGYVWPFLMGPPLVENGKYANTR